MDVELGICTKVIEIKLTFSKDLLSQKNKSPASMR